MTIDEEEKISGIFRNYESQLNILNAKYVFSVRKNRRYKKTIKELQKALQLERTRRRLDQGFSNNINIDNITTEK